MAKPSLFYLSMLRTGTLTDPGSAAGYPIANIKDMKSYTVWKSNGVTSPINIDIDNGGSTQNADYIAFVNHNLFTNGATVEVRADTFTPPTTVRLAAFSPAEDTVTLRTLTAPGALRYWRIVITDPAPPFAAAPSIGDLYLGMKTTLPEYMTPGFDPFFDGVEVAGSRSEGGHALGATTRGHTHRARLSFGAAGAARADYTATLNAFIDNHANKRQPFFFVLDTDDTDFDTPRFIRHTDGGHISRMAVGGSWQRLTLDMDVEEAYMEPVV